MKTILFAFALLLVALAPWCAPDAAAQTPAPGTPAPKAPPAAPPQQKAAPPQQKAAPSPQKAVPRQQAAPRQEEDPEKIYREMRGEWRRNGPGFGCAVTFQRQPPPPNERQVEAMYFACLYMGPFQIRGEAAALKTLGTPARSLPQPKGATAWVYLLEAPWPVPYLVATVLNDRIVALQISGPARSQKFSFNNINLGDGTETLLKHFGSPKHIGPSGRKDVDLWEYKPWTFTFEIENDRVTSIRIADPGY